MIANLDLFISSFLEYYKKDKHSSREDQYPELKTINHLLNLDKEKFIEYIFQFARIGGGIQSGGARNASRLKQEMENDFDRFKEYLLQPYRFDFDVGNWLGTISNYKFFGVGLATIYLNRIDKNRFVVVNEKSKDALQILGYDIKRDPVGAFFSIKAAQDDLLKKYPQIENYYIADFINHYLIATPEGKSFYENPIADMIENYKQRKKQEGHSAEFYKYEAIQHFQKNWNIDSPDFPSMLKRSLMKQRNLMYALSYGTILNVANKFQEQIKGLFEYLFDESIELATRIKTFGEKVDYFQKELKPTDNGFQDERAISVYLTFRYPDKYTFYKHSYYSKYCKLIGEKEKPVGQRYIHYLDLIESLKELYIFDDVDLWNLTNENLPKSVWPDEECNVLAQDILYVALDQNIVPNYWIFQGNPKFFDVVGSLRDNALQTWKVVAHKSKITPGDKVIIWVTGEKSGCYALAKVISDVEVHPDSSKEKSYYTELGEEELTEKVVIEIEKNLWNRPILREDLLSRPEFSDFKGGNQGTNFTATKEQYNLIKELAMNNTIYLSESEYSLVNVIRIIDNELLVRSHLEDAERVCKSMGVAKDDMRIVFSVPKHKKLIAFTVNQRYISNVSEGSIDFCLPPKAEPEYGSRPDAIRVGHFNPLPGEEIAPIWIQFKHSATFTDEFFELYQEAAKDQLSKASISNFIKYDNDAYRNCVFDGIYRNKILSIAFSDAEIVVEPSVAGTPLPKQKPDLPKNLILYGPPGTGKTFKLTNEYKKWFVDKDVSKTKEVYTYELVNDLSWWEVITLTMLDLNMAKVNEMVKHPLIEEKINQSKNTKPRNTIWYNLQFHTSDECLNVKVAKKSDLQIFWKDSDSTWSIDKAKTEEILPDLIEKYDSWKNYQPSHSLTKRYEMITFHQSYSYEEFMEGIRPEIDNEEELKYKLEPGVFLKIAEKAKKDSKNPYAIFIDEINRGNISKIFGELITLIEPDKRAGEENEIEVTLPYSKSKFSVPPNLYIIGTMNSADRSIALIDTALRRRFHFVEMMPDSSLLNENVEGINLRTLLDKINERIEFLLDRDHTIGHSYLMNVHSKNDLSKVFKNKILPLLQEYFYNDWNKIQLVLGDHDKWGKRYDQKLVRIKKYYSVNAEKELFGYDLEDYEDETIYEINPTLTNKNYDQIPVNSFIYIYSKPKSE
ncbi:AAA family ATPase [Maribellus sediminis]|uniref:AAA family ATPase n=1 Tax=Maribellus sediminis TaxID=2696285 RepID=UPI001431D56E|nr:AAA family ATPase [Maribellus sediminis]